MKLTLSCSETNRRALIELLSSRGITVEDMSAIQLVERGVPLPDRGIAIVYDPDNLNEFLDFLDGLKPSAASDQDSPVVLGRRGERYELLKLEEIIGFVADGNYVYCLSPAGKLEVKKKLYELENEWSSKGFIRVNKSFLLNILMVSEITPWFGGRLLIRLKGIGDEIEVSRAYAQSFKKFIGM